MADWQQVYVADHPFAAAAVAGALRAAGIEARVSGTEFWSVAVEMLYSKGAAPAVWVPAEYAPQAAEWVARHERAALDSAADDEWLCARCRAAVPSTFDICWRCGAPPAECSG